MKSQFYNFCTALSLSEMTGQFWMYGVWVRPKSTDLILADVQPLLTKLFTGDFD